MQVCIVLIEAVDMSGVCSRVRIRFSVIHSLFEDVFAQFENTEGGQEDTDDDASPQVCRFIDRQSDAWGLIVVMQMG